MVFSETIHAMLLTRDKFRQLTPKEIKSGETSEVLICMSPHSRGVADETVGKPARQPAGIYSWSEAGSRLHVRPQLEDPDGRFWEVAWMDVAAVRP